MSLSVLGLGLLMGMQHAFEADHLAAVSSLVSRRRGIRTISWHGAVWGIGAGQQNRRDSGRIAAEKAAGRAVGGACASDAFFPFRDGLDAAAEAGCTAVVQPGGSVRDELVVEAAKKAGVTMYFTGTRHFFH